jgi:hypothetical protein
MQANCRRAILMGMKIGWMCDAVWWVLPAGIAAAAAARGLQIHIMLIAS